MARVFISFAMEDKVLRDFLVGQKKNARTAIEFTDYSAKEPWDSSWKTNCRARIKGWVQRHDIGLIIGVDPALASHVGKLELDRARFGNPQTSTGLSPKSRDLLYNGGAGATAYQSTSAELGQ